MDVARLLVAVDANVAGAEAGLASLHKQLTIAAIGFGVIGVAAIGAGVLAVKMAGDFQRGITTLVTGAGESTNSLRIIRAGVKQIALDTGTTTAQLISGLYMIESAGYHGANGLHILQLAAEGARAEGADLGDVSNALTGVLTDYPHVINGAAGAMNVLIATVAHGKTHLQDLATSLGTVLATAAVSHIRLYDVMGALAAMTAKTVPAAQAATYLRMTILTLLAPGAGAKKMLQEIGLSSDKVATELQKNMPAALQMIVDALSKKFKPGSAAFVAALKEIAGGTKTASGLMLLAGQGTSDFADRVKAIAKQAKEGGQSVLHWDLIQQGFNFQMAKLRELLEVAFISLGQHLLPVLTKVVKYIVDNAIPAVKGLTKFWEDHKAIIIIVAAIIAGALAASFIVWAATAAAAAVATIAATWEILAVGAAIALLIAGLIYAYKNWGWFRAAVDNAVVGLKFGIKILGDYIGRLGDMLGMLGRVKDAIGAAFGALGNLMGKAKGFTLPGFASGTSFTPGGAFIGAEQGPELLLTPGMYSAPKGSTILNARETADVLRMPSGGSGTTYNIYPAKSQFDASDMDRLQRRRALLGSRSGGYS